MLEHAIEHFICHWKQIYKKLDTSHTYKLCSDMPIDFIMTTEQKNSISVFFCE